MNKTTDYKKVGLWLDHSHACFIDVSKGPAGIETVFSDKESEVRFAGEHGNGTQLGNNRSTNSEYHQHNRSNEVMHNYYRVLTDRLKAYGDIYLFGPTVAKDELYNQLKADKNFSDKVINVESSDQLTENQMVAKVKKFYNL